VSARHQVKRLDRTIESPRAFRPVRQKKQSFLRSVRILVSAISPAAFGLKVKSGPDVFADALVPRDGNRASRSISSIPASPIASKPMSGFRRSLPPLPRRAPPWLPRRQNGW
jgi:hypothetical protein